MVSVVKDKLLLIEDDEQLAEAITSYFEIKGYTVEKALTAESALECLNMKNFSLILLDLTLPDEDGLVLLRKIKQRYDTPIIIASGRIESEQRIAGLEIGAEDFVCKPFIIRELELRIQALIKRAKQIVKSDKHLSFDQYFIDDKSKQIKNLENIEVALTPLEYQVVQYMASNINKVLSREQIIDATNTLDGPESNRAVDICISRIRKKLEKDPKHPKILVTVKGFGYRLTDAVM